MNMNQTEPIAGGMQNGFDVARVEELSSREKDLVLRRQRVLGTAYKLMYDHPVEFVKAKGVHMYDAAGNEYLDCYNNVVSVGHCNQRVIDAVTRQLTTLNTHTRYLSEPILSYTEKLLQTFEPDLDNAMYTCTGSEAVDLALRIAKFYTKGTGIIITDYAYHGITSQVAAISSSMGPFTPLDRDVRMVPAPNAYRAKSGEDVGLKFAKDIENAIIDMERHGIRFAGFIADSIFSTDGLLTDPVGFLQPAIEAVRKFGGLYIADEVQPGFGRTGSHMWGYQRHSIVPDIVVMGKPMGNGLPIAAVVTRHEILEDFGNKARYFNTFGGNPVSIAAAEATLYEIQNGARQNCAKVGKYLLDGFKRMMTKFPQIGDVRGAGMYFAVEFVIDRMTKEPDSKLARKVVGELRERHILISTTGKFSNCLKIRPLLIFDIDDANRLLHEFEAVMSSVVTAGGTNSSSLVDKASLVTVDQATELLKRYYNMEASVVKLRGERDQNFLVRSENGNFVLKVLHPSEDEEFSNFQTRMMLHISHKNSDIPIQKVVTPTVMTAGGSHLDLRIKLNDEMRTVRLVTYIEGPLMSAAPGSLKQKYNLGVTAGKITLALQSFHHVGQNHVILWDVQHASDLREYLNAIELKIDQVEMLERCFRNFELKLKPSYPHLRRGIVHNDYNEDNVVVDSKDKDTIAGILDFGDAVYTPIVNDVGVGAVYQLGVEGSDLLDGAVEFIKGYNLSFPLIEEEISVIYDVMLTRMFVRIVLHTWRASKFPENSEYILRNIQQTWEYLALMLRNETEYRRKIEAISFSK